MGVVQESLVEMASNQLRDLVLVGQIRPGEKLNEPPLSAQLGISRPPLREAMRVLEGEGLLRLTPRRGYRVAEFGPRDTEEIYGLRHVLEEYAVTKLLATERAVSLAPLDDVLASMRIAAEQADSLAIVRGNVDFHVGVIEATGDQHLARVYRILMQQMQIFMGANIRHEAGSVGSLVQGYERHRSLLEVLRVGTREQILDALKTHGARTYLPADQADPAVQGAPGPETDEATRPSTTAKV